MGWEYLGILVLISAILCITGFYKYVYFISIGYGSAIAGIGVTLLVLCALGQFRGSVAVSLLCVLFFLYGVRLAGFLLQRELRNKAYKKILNETARKKNTGAIGISLVTWIGVSILYVAQTSPVFFRLYNGGKVSLFVWVGSIICVGGICLESLADLQKGRQKKERPGMVATKGLYRIVRCPNYLGEILFWTGVLVSGLDAIVGAGQWIMALAGYGCIVFIMFNGAMRLEKGQMKRYGKKKEYQEYANHTPILLPWIPLYHLNKQ